jgi:hypothetical protein
VICLLKTRSTARLSARCFSSARTRLYKARGSAQAQTERPSGGIPARSVVPCRLRAREEAKELRRLRVWARPEYTLALLVVCSATVTSRQHPQLVCCFSHCGRLQCRPCRPYAVRQSCARCQRTRYTSNCSGRKTMIRPGHKMPECQLLSCVAQVDLSISTAAQAPAMCH